MSKNAQTNDISTNLKLCFIYGVVNCKTMKERVITIVIVASITIVGWTVLKSMVGFETTVLVALATIFASQK